MEDKTAIERYCANLGADSLLVQGAGGNASWKENDILWVKASGKCLADADKDNIFLPIDLAHLKHEIIRKNFEAIPIKKSLSTLRPSIETILHALMPHRIVLHLHPIEVLACLVRKNCLDTLKKLPLNSIKWEFIDYFQPGAALAEALFIKLASNPKPDVVFLKNHGVILGGENITRIDELLGILTNNFNNVLISFNNKQSDGPYKSIPKIDGYSRSLDIRINRLALDERLSKRLEVDWVLYPDHAVFLGGSPWLIKTDENFVIPETFKNPPPYIFALNYGVLEHKSLTEAQKSQLQCYYDVLIRQSPTEHLDPLTVEQIESLLNWDAEKYRLKISKK